MLSLVPPTTPYTAGQVLREMASGPWDSSLDSGLHDALGALIGYWVGLGVGLDDLRVLREYNAHVQRTWDARALVGCDIRAELEVARRTLDWRDVRVASMLNNP